MTRRTYVYDEATGKMVEGRSPGRTEGSGDGWKFSDRLYSAAPFVGVDGTVIDSKRKHRAYMKKHNLTTADDFTNEWKQKRAERDKFYTEGGDRDERRRQIAQIVEAKSRG